MKDSNRQQKGFTLAEVLITLTIIGVIAALTIPNLIKKYEHKEYEAGFKKAWAKTNEAVKMASSEMGVQNLVSETTWPCTEAINQIYQHLGITPNVSKTYKYAKATKSYSGKGFGWPASGYLSGNMLFNIYSMEQRTIFIIVDTNGLAGPNRHGYDIWGFSIVGNQYGVFHPTGYGTRLSAYTWNDYSTNYCNNPGLGYSTCAYYAYINQNPHNRTKGYWDSLD